MGKVRIWNGRQIPSARALGALPAFTVVLASSCRCRHPPSLSLSLLSPKSPTLSLPLSSSSPHRQRELAGGRNIESIRPKVRTSLTSSLAFSPTSSYYTLPPPPLPPPSPTSSSSSLPSLSSSAGRVAHPLLSTTTLLIRATSPPPYLYPPLVHRSPSTSHPPPHSLSSLYVALPSSSPLVVAPHRRPSPRRLSLTLPILPSLLSRCGTYCCSLCPPRRREACPYVTRRFPVFPRLRPPCHIAPSLAISSLVLRPPPFLPRSLLLTYISYSIPNIIQTSRCRQ